ncbi:pleckstrin (PH) domain-containing protein [Tieghemostelium lacteum]|uniref:Pleckstrin (PH) domain-containing protein n=1 Tax=Tieghemostelium lacteum TaxID=361077 RepID=A0A151Z6A2_TIELA|nr:pleckstrin (PH) domain-containing protein [Tieghemostelium lacteum]|eukprot:KYQ89475.1 pleckstrin (PH) domain-containing protein [Tieghemostelium lacteum]
MSHSENRKENNQTSKQTSNTPKLNWFQTTSKVAAGAFSKLGGTLLACAQVFNWAHREEKEREERKIQEKQNQKKQDTKFRAYDEERRIIEVQNQMKQDTKFRAYDEEHELLR